VGIETAVDVATRVCDDKLGPTDQPTTYLNPALTAASLIVASAALRLLYLLWDCPLDLSPDEAHYWDWSRHLDWSYYSKGPVVAYLIRISCGVFGETMWAVRLPAIVCGSLTLAGVYVLTYQVFRQPYLALCVVAVALTQPILAAGSLLMTIDAPYVCCWTWALVVAHSALRHNDTWAVWILLGLLVGIGTLAKYTMLVFLPSYGLFLLASASHRYRLVSPRFWAMVLTASICCLPIVIWNAQHEWVTVLHVAHQAGMNKPNHVGWTHVVEFLGGQVALLLGLWFVLWVWVMMKYSPLVKGNLTESQQLLWWMSGPMFVLFFAVSLATRVEPNWPITTYISGLVLVAGWLSAVWRMSRTLRVCVMASAAIGLLATVFVHHTEWLYPLHSGLIPSVNPRRWDATCRLRGWRELSQELSNICQEVRREGEEPVTAGDGWNLPGIMAFYLPDHPVTYSLGLVTGGRHSQYDFWRPNLVSDPDRFSGATIVYVGAMTPAVAAGFEHVRLARNVTCKVGGYSVASWQVYVCRGFRGFHVPQTSPH
jgi:hypothetical protein